MSERTENIWWRLKDAWSHIAKILPYQFIPFAGFVYSIIIFIEDIGIAIKLSDLKAENRSEFKNLFKYYLIHILAPVVNQLFFAKAINDIMKFLGTQGVKQEDISYVEKKGKTFGYLGIIGQSLLFCMIFIEYFILFYFSFSLRSSGYINPNFFLIFLLIYFASLFTILLAFWIASVILQVKILKRLISCIELTGLDKATVG